MKTYCGMLALVLTPWLLPAADITAVIPKAGPPLAGPYTPGVFAGDYLYVSGQGAKKPDGSLPATFEEQVKQTLDNVKLIVEAAGLTMDHVVYAQVYLEDMAKYAEMNRIYRTYFRNVLPARATLGVAKLPGTPVEINAVAIRNAADKRAVSVAGFNSGEPASAGVLTKERLFVSGMRGATSADPAAQVKSALDGMESVLKAAGLTMAHLVFVNPYLTRAIPSGVMNGEYAKRFEFGNTPARATIEVASLPDSAQIEFTGVAVRDLSQRKAVRPKNMQPSPTASPCVFAGDTLYCSAKSASIPGPNGGVFVAAIDQQFRLSMRNQLDNLEEAGMDFSNVVAANVYVDDLNDFATMNGIYAKYFKGVAPARTTIQPMAPGDRTPRAEGQYLAIEQVSFVAVRK